MAGAFLYNNLIASSAGVTVPGAEASAGVSNLLDPQPRLRCRVIGAGGASILVDLGATRSVDCVFLGSTTASSSASVRVRLSTVDTTGAAGDAWDTGGGLASTGAEANGNVVIIRSAGTASGRYVLIELAHGLSVMDIGIVAIGALLRLPINPLPGQVIGRRILDMRPRNMLTAAEFPMAALGNPRFEAFGVDLLTEADVTGQLRTMLYQAGAWSDGLYIPDISLSQSELNNRSIWGALAEPGTDCGVEQYNIGAYRRSWRMVERM